MKTFLTRYSSGGYHFGAYLEAASLADARAVARARGLNESIEGEVNNPAMPHRLASLIAEERWIDAAHEATFLGFVGLSSGALSYRELLGDHGLIHELLHLQTFAPPHPDEAPEIVASDAEERRQRIAAVRLMARDFEYRVPGHQPSFDRPDKD